MRKPHVLMVTPRYHPFSGGVETHVAEVSARLARHGFNVSVLTTNPHGSLLQSEVLDGINVCRVRTWSGSGDFYFAPAIYSGIDAANCDLLHVQSYHTFVAPLAMVAALRWKLPYVLTFHGGGHSSRLRHAARPIQRRALRPLIRRAARLVAVAPFEVDQYSAELKLRRSQFVVIPNGSDLRLVNVGAPSPSAPPLIVSIGRLERYKGHQRVIAAFPRVQKRYPDAHLWIAGTGPYEDRLKRQIARLGLEESVEIRAIPPGEREKLAQELSKAALICVLSEFESHPIAALEALALGRRLLVSDAPGLRELAHQGLVHVIPLRASSETVAAAIVEGLSTPHVQTEIRLPTWDTCAASLASLYRTVLANADDG